MQSPARSSIGEGTLSERLLRRRGRGRVVDPAGSELLITGRDPGVVAQFSLLDVTDMEPFRAYGRRLAVNPSDELRRSVIAATVRLGPSGIPEVDLTTRAAQDRIHSQGTLLAPEDAGRELLHRLLAAPQVPPTASQVGAAAPIVEAFLEGLGSAVEHLGAWLDQAAGGLIQLVQKKLRESVGPVVLSESVRYVEYARARTGRPRTSQDVLGEFARGVGYTGFNKSLYAEDWFDSRPERDLANIVDQADSVVMWLRLQRGDLTILWRGQSSWYSPRLPCPGRRRGVVDRRGEGGP